MQQSYRRRARQIATLASAVALVSGVACDGGEQIVVKGPGLVPNINPLPLRAGAAAVVRVGWAAAGPAPALRLRWTIGDTAVVRIDSVAVDTRTAYLTARAVGRTSLAISDPDVQTVTTELVVQ